MSKLAAKCARRPNRRTKIDGQAEDRVDVPRALLEDVVRLFDPKRRAAMIEEEHRVRVQSRLVEEAKRARAQADEYEAICEEANDAVRPVSEMTAAGVLAYATGTCEYEPINALLQEIHIRLRTLRAAVGADDVAMDENDWDMELYMLERRAEAVIELLSRERAGVRAAHVPAPAETSAETPIDAAAEE